MAIAEREVGNMLREALRRSDTPVKSLAKETNYSVDAFYASMAGKRKIPQEARKAIAEIHALGGLAVAYESTGYRCFTILQGDQHPQNVLQKCLKEDRDVDIVMEDMGFRLIDKQAPEDLTPDDVIALKAASKEVIEEVRALLSLLIVWEDRFHIGLIAMLNAELTEKEKAVIETAR